MGVSASTIVLAHDQRDAEPPVPVGDALDAYAVVAHLEICGKSVT